LASSALAILKMPQHNSNALKKSSLAIPISLMAMAKMHSKVSLSAISIWTKLEINKPKGLRKFVIYGLRFVQLGLIFLPSILLLPLAIFKVTRNIWMNCFVWSISKAGVVWIKVFQHMSHRGDVIGDDLA
jgi:uncharacterized membrane protein YGL010W